MKRRVMMTVPGEHGELLYAARAYALACERYDRECARAPGPPSRHDQAQAAAMHGRADAHAALLDAALKFRQFEQDLDRQFEPTKTTRTA